MGYHRPRYHHKRHHRHRPHNERYLVSTPSKKPSEKIINSVWKRRLIIAGSIFAFLILGSYLFGKLSEETKMTFGIGLVIIVVIALMIYLSTPQKPKFATPEEESAYNKRKAELLAERDFKR